MEFGFQQITLILLFAWFVMFVAGRIQQKRIKTKLFDRIQSGIEPALAENPDLQLDAYYEWVFAEWDDIVKSSAWFVLSTNELYPVAAHPGRIKEQMNLTPEWLGAYLKLNGTELQMDETQQAAIATILEATPKQRNGFT